MTQISRAAAKAAVAAGLSALATLALSTPGVAQDAAFGRDVWLKQANCSDCHGWLANGQPEDPRAPKGANLRQTTLNAAQIAEVILCGRPGTPMPYFDTRAYTDARCYGMTKAQMGDAVPEPAISGLTKRHADGLAAFILGEFAGKGDPTFEDCVSLLGAGNPRCTALPKKAN